ncbi:hypothetical protein R84981_001731 [Carnimonas sp. R-84981]|uniref:helix-turn-helix domain-containing protein n=1 Tax=Carnimonas bestiolae TaxID=3402172 RepID=UPI003EDC514E
MSTACAHRIIDTSAWGNEPPRWIELLAAEVEATNMTRAGARVGVSRSAVSLALANRYPSPSTERIERRVLDALDRIQCLVANDAVSSVECQSFREKPAPTHNPMAMRLWSKCQRCPHNPNRETCQ